MGWKVVMHVLGLRQHTQQQNEGIEKRINIELLIEKVDEQAHEAQIEGRNQHEVSKEPRQKNT